MALRQELEALLARVELELMHARQSYDATTGSTGRYQDDRGEIYEAWQSVARLEDRQYAIEEVLDFVTDDD